MQIAMSCSGTNAYRYGTMKDWVVSLTVVLADGTVVKTRNRPRKSSAGYDLTHLIIGSEGTLGIVTEAVLKLTVAPKNLHVGVATFPNVSSAVSTAIAAINSGELLEAIEFVDQHSMRALNNLKLSEEIWDEKPTLFLKFAGSEQVVEHQINMVAEMARKRNHIDFRCSSLDSDINSWWGARKAVARGIISMKKDPSDVFLTADAAVPISKMAEMILATERATEQLGFYCSNIGHIGDGQSLFCWMSHLSA